MRSATIAGKIAKQRETDHRAEAIVKDCFQAGSAFVAVCVVLTSGCNPQPQSSGQGPFGGPSDDAPAMPSTIVGENPGLPADDLLRLDLASLISSGAIKAEHNAGWNNFPRRLTDGDTGTFKTTNGVDPVVLTIAFQQPTKVQAVRLLLSGAPQYDWTVRAGSEGPSFTTRQAGSDKWSRLDLLEPLTTQLLVLELSRPGPDHTLSVHEIEVYGPHP